MEAKTNTPSGVFEFDAFISYSTDPDYRLVRKTESFLESIDQLKTPEELELKKLEICVDGSDFRLPRVSGADESQHLPKRFKDRIIEYLEKSARLIVFCSPQTKKSTWVEDEIRLFLKMRSPDDIFLVVTGGDDPVNRPEEVFHDVVIERGLHRKLYFDFRQYYQKHSALRFWKTNEHASQKKVRAFEAERVRLAAELQPDKSITAGVIQPLWFDEQTKMASRNRAIVMMIAFLVGTGIGLGFLAQSQRELRLLSQSRTLAERANTLSDAGEYTSAMLTALEGLPSGEGLLDPRPWSMEAIAALTRAVTSNRLRAIIPAEGLSLDGGRPSIDHMGTIAAISYKSKNEQGTIVRILDLMEGRVVMTIDRASEQYILSPDGVNVAVGFNDGTVSVWKVAENRIIAKFRDLNSRVEKLAFSQDGRTVAAGSVRAVAAWDLDSQSITARIELPDQERIKLIAFSEDGRTLAIANGSRAIVWDLEKQRELWSVDELDQISDIALSSNRDILAVADNSRGIRLFIIGSGKQERLKDNDELVSALQFNPQGLLVAVSPYGCVRVWDLSTREFNLQPGVPIQYWQPVISANGSRTVTAQLSNRAITPVLCGQERFSWGNSVSGVAVVWDTATNEQIARVAVWPRRIKTVSDQGGTMLSKFHRDDEISRYHGNDAVGIWESGIVAEVSRFPHTELLHPRFTRDGHHVVTAVGERLFLWHATSGKEVNCVGDERPTVADSTQFETSPVDSHIATFTPKGALEIWNVQGCTMLARRQIAPGARLESISFSFDGRFLSAAVHGTRIFSGSNDGILVWDARDLREYSRIPWSDGWQPRHVRFSRDQKKLVAYGDDKSVRSWVWADQSQPIRHDFPEVQEVGIPAFGSAARNFYTVIGSEVRIHEFDSGRIVAKLQHWGEAGQRLGFGPTGERALVLGLSSANLWDWRNERLVDTLRHESGLEWKISDAAFSPGKEQKFILTASYDGTARLWESSSGLELMRIEHEERVQSAQFSPDGSHVLTWAVQGSAARLTKIPSFSRVQLVDLSCRRLQNGTHPEVWKLPANVPTQGRVDPCKKIGVLDARWWRSMVANVRLCCN